MSDALSRWEGREKMLLRSLAQSPDDPGVLLQLGVLRLQRGDAIGAREVLLHAHVLQPTSVPVRIYAAKALSECSDYRAPQLIAEWRQWLPLPDQLQYDLADVMQRTDWTAEAIGVLEDLLHRDPVHRWARLLLAALYERVSRLKDAKVLVEGMLAADAGDDAVVRNELMHQRAGLFAREGGNREARMMLERAGPRFENDVEHFFMLGTIADHLGDVEASMQSLSTAHALQRQQLERVAPERLQEGASLLPAAQASLSAEEAARWPRLIAPDSAQSPVFVVGFPRSGTTLLEQMLDAHPSLQAMDERPHFAMLADQLEDYGVRVPQELHKLTQADCDELRKGYLLMTCTKIERRWNARLVDKNPLNMLWLPLMHRMFPDARIILMLRHPCDALLSNYVQNYRSAVMMSVSLDLERLARAYVDAFSAWFHHAEILKPAVLAVRYEDLVDDPGKEALRLGRFLGIENTGAMLQPDRHARSKGFIGTPSYSEVIRPIHPRSIGRWRRYRPWFEGALRILEPMMPRVGYSAGDEE